MYSDPCLLFNSLCSEKYNFIVYSAFVWIWITRINACQLLTFGRPIAMPIPEGFPTQCVTRLNFGWLQSLLTCALDHHTKVLNWFAEAVGMCVEEMEPASWDGRRGVFRFLLASSYSYYSMSTFAHHKVWTNHSRSFSYTCSQASELHQS